MTTYVLAIFLLFFLGVLNRFLGALKSQLEKRWNTQHRTETAFTLRVRAKKTVDSSIISHTRKWSHVLRAEHRKREELDKEEVEPLTPTSADLLEDEESGIKANSKTSHGLWLAHAPWRIDRDGISAGLEFVRALIGYVLYVSCFHRNVPGVQLTTL